jgi:hypothetical protein
MGDLVEFRDQIEFRQPDATPVEDRPARELELTRNLLDTVRERGLVFQVANNGTLRIVNPALQAEFDEANAALREADRAVKTFWLDHAEELEAERRKADADSIRSALSGDDGDAIREAISSHLPASPPHRQRVTVGV